MPADFGDNEVVWTVTSPNGKTYRAYGTLNPDYFIDNYVVQRNNGLTTADNLPTNQAPVLDVESAAARAARVGEAVTLTAFASDDGLPKARPMRPYDASRPGSIVPSTATGLRLSWFVVPRPGATSPSTRRRSRCGRTRGPNSNSPWGPGWETPRGAARRQVGGEHDLPRAGGRSCCGAWLTMAG